MKGITGTREMGEVIFGPHYAFGLPGVLMALATLIFWLGRHDFAHIPLAVKHFLWKLFLQKI